MPALAVMTEGTDGVAGWPPRRSTESLPQWSSFYEYTIMAEEYHRENPIQKAVDRAAQRVPGSASAVPGRHQPTATHAPARSPSRQFIACLGRSQDEQVGALFEALRSKRIAPCCT
jgi:hypothetical protein